MGHDAEHGAVAQHATSAQFQLGGIRKTHTAVKADRTSLSWPYSGLCSLHHPLEYECRFPASFPLLFALRGFAYKVFSSLYTLRYPPGNASSFCRGNFLVFCFSIWGYSAF
jgi:hypothetical protein